MMRTDHLGDTDADGKIILN